jgi:hypothetical protein
MADQLVMAMAEGKLDEFIKKEMPDNEYSKALTMMMMGMTGMTGMMPPGGFAPPAEEKKPATGPDEATPPESASAAQPPEDVLKAVHSADVKGLTGLLQREYIKMNPGAEPADTAAPARSGEKPAPGTPQGMEKALVDQLVSISEENGVTVDWLIMRAMKLYVQEYGKTGRL